MVFCLLVFASPGPFAELGSADGKPLSATSAPAAGCVIHTLVYYITFSPCAQLFCPVSAEKLTCFRRIPFSSPMLFYRLIVFNGRGVSQRLAYGTLSTFMGGGSFAPPAPLSPAPAVLIFPLCKRRRICFQTDRQDAAVPERSSFRCQDSLPVISRQPALRRLIFPAARPAPQSGRRRRRCRSKA